MEVVIGKLKWKGVSRLEHGLSESARSLRP